MADPIPKRPRRPLDEDERSADRLTTSRPPAGWHDVAEEMIEEAIRSGAFDNLPGSGKPLTLINNPFAPGTELAYQLLKDNQYTLPWISERAALLARIQALRDEIASTWSWYQHEHHPESYDSRQISLAQEWSTLTVSWEERISSINKDVAELNLKQPTAQLEILKLSLSGELDRAGVNQTLG